MKVNTAMRASRLRLEPVPVDEFAFERGEEVARYQVGCLAAAVAPRGDGELAAAHPGKSGLAHQPGDALAADANARSREVDLDAGGTIGAVRGCMRRTDALGQRAVARCPP